MKKYISILAASIAVAVSCLILVSCSDSSNESAADKNKKLLTGGTWHIANVTADDVDKTGLFTGFTLTFSPATFSSKNGGPLWPASDTWSFTSKEAMAFVRGDDVEIDIISLTESKLKLTFHWNETTLMEGRVNSVMGEYIFEFNR